MTVIYTWPPLRHQSTIWTNTQPSRTSRDIDGMEYVSSDGPSRRTAQVTCSALAGDRDGAGMCESLNVLLGGGMNLVRFEIPVLNWHRDVWDAPMDLDGLASVGTVTTSGGFAAIALSGLVPGAVVCRAFDLIGSYTSGALVSSARAVRTVRAALDGTAVIPLHAAIPAGVISIGETEDAVMRATMTPGVQPVRGDWSYSWTLREVLSEQIPSGATEVDPWG